MNPLRWWLRMTGFGRSRSSITVCRARPTSGNLGVLLELLGYVPPDEFEQAYYRHPTAPADLVTLSNELSEKPGAVQSSRGAARASRRASRGGLENRACARSSARRRSVEAVPARRCVRRRRPPPSRRRGARK